MRLLLIMVAVAALSVSQCSAGKLETREQLLERIEEVLREDGDTPADPAAPEESGSTPEESGSTPEESGSTPEESESADEPAQQLDAHTLGKLWAINVEVTMLAARCESWWSFVQVQYANPANSEILSHACPRLYRAYIEYESATKEEKEVKEAEFMGDLDRVYQATACTNLFVTIEGMQGSCVHPVNSITVHVALGLLKECWEVFENEHAAENETDKALEKVAKEERGKKEGGQKEGGPKDEEGRKRQLVDKMLGLVTKAHERHW